MNVGNGRSAKLLNRKFRQYLIPMILISVAGSLSEFVDAIIVSHLLGKEAMAIVNLGMPIVLVFSTVYMLICVGGSSEFATKLGENNRNEGYKVFWISMGAVALLSVIMLIAGSIYSGEIAGLLTKAGKLKQQLGSYCRVLFLSAPVFMIVNGITYFLTGDGQPNLATAVQIAANVGNVVMDYVYIHILHMGINGAAYATMTGYLAGLVMILTAIAIRKVRFKLVRIQFQDLKKLPHICEKGIGNAAGQFGYAFKFSIINSLAAIYAGMSGVIVFSVCIQTLSFTSVFLAGVVMTMTPIIAMLKGEKDYKGMRFVWTQSLRYTMIFSAAILLLFESCPQFVAAIYKITDQTENGMVVTGIRIFSLVYIFRNFYILLMSYAQTVGRKILTLTISILDSVLPVAFALLLGAAFGVYGISWAFPLSAAMICILIVLYDMYMNRRAGGGKQGIFSRENEKIQCPVFDISIKGSVQEAVDASRQIIEFARLNKVDNKTANMVGMAIEEMAVFTIESSANHEKCEIDILARIYEKDIQIQFRSGGRPFSPTAFMESEQADSMEISNMQMLKKISSSVSYDCILGMNVTICTLERV